MGYQGEIERSAPAPNREMKLRFTNSETAVNEMIIAYPFDLLLKIVFEWDQSRS